MFLSTGLSGALCSALLFLFFFSFFLPSSLSFFLYFCVCLYLFRAALAAYGSYQATGWLRVAAASLHHSHSNTGLSSICNPHRTSRQCWILKRGSLSEARDQTHVLMDTSQVLNALSHKGSSSSLLFLPPPPPPAIFSPEASLYPVSTVLDPNSSGRDSSGRCHIVCNELLIMEHQEKKMIKMVKGTEGTTLKECKSNHWKYNFAFTNRFFLSNQCAKIGV